MAKRPLEPLADDAMLQRATSTADYFSSGRYVQHVDCVEKMARHQAERKGFACAPADAPPQVTRGERVAATLILEGGKLLEVTERRGWGGDSAFIDWLNFTVSDQTFSGDWNLENVVSDEQLILDCSAACEFLFGFGITKQREKGANFYQRSYVLGDGYGMVCHGGQRGSLLVSLSGEGCQAAKHGWEKRVYEFLEKDAINGKITRVDLAHDVYDGLNYDVDRAFEDYKIDLFNAGGRTPDCEHRGNWHKPNGKGRSFYVGHRTNGKYARVYEKGKQLGGVASPWVRCEVEFKSVDRLIPFDVLLRAGEYLAASYPALAWISARAERILTNKKIAEVNYETMVNWLHRQCGGALWVLSMIEGSAEKALSKVVQVGKVPARLVVPDSKCDTVFIHRKKRGRVPLGVVLDTAFRAC